MSLQEIELLVSLIATGVGLLATAISFIIKVIKDIKEKKLQKLIEQLMIEAEKIGMSGKEKKKYVIDGVLEYGKAYYFNAKTIVEKVSVYIEECIAFSKQINSK